VEWAKVIGHPPGDDHLIEVRIGLSPRRLIQPLTAVMAITLSSLYR
jgi:hypothetical protein